MNPHFGFALSLRLCFRSVWLLGLSGWVALAGATSPGSHDVQPLLAARAEIRLPRASFIDVAARMKRLREGPRDAHLLAAWPALGACSPSQALAPPTRPMQIPPRYLKGNTGPVHPQYEAAVAQYRDFEDHLARLANAYLASAQPAFAHCLVDQLALWADAEALLDYTVSESSGASKQAWYQVEWSTAASALALSQVIAEPTLQAEKLQHVLAWLRRVSAKQISFPGGENTCCNNHAYWRGLHATMVGVLTNDLALYRWGLGRYTLAIDHLAPDGRWPLEMARKEQSLHYQNYALLPLVLIAEIAAQQGLDLYAYRSAGGQDLHSAITFLAANSSQASRWQLLGLPPQDTRAFAPGRSDQSWAEFYRARFGRDPLGWLSQPNFNARTGGNSALLAYKVASTNAPRIDLRPWKLQLPDAKASEVAPERLAQGYQSEFFEVEPDGSLLFSAVVGGGTTTNAKYTRSELREMLDPADRTRNWTSQGGHRMRLRQAVLQAPRSGRVVVFQIHAVQPDGSHAPPLVKAQWRDGTMQFLVKRWAKGGEDIVYEVPGVPLGQAYEGSLEVRDGRLIMQAMGVTFSDDFVQRDADWQALRFYFKAGNYPQDRDAGDGTNRSVVRIHELQVSHE